MILTLCDQIASYWDTIFHVVSLFDEYTRIHKNTYYIVDVLDLHSSHLLAMTCMSWAWHMQKIFGCTGRSWFKAIDSW